MEVCCAALRMEYQKRGIQSDFIEIILIFFEACAGLDSKYTKEIPFFIHFTFCLIKKYSKFSIFSFPLMKRNKNLDLSFRFASYLQPKNLLALVVINSISYYTSASRPLHYLDTLPFHNL